MVAMTKTIARAYAKDGILAFAICPGFTMTGMDDEYLASRGGDKLLADIQLGRVAMPDEVGGRAGWCAMDAPASMTSAVLDANGASHASEMIWTFYLPCTGDGAEVRCDDRKSRRVGKEW